MFDNEYCMVMFLLNVSGRHLTFTNDHPYTTICEPYKHLIITHRSFYGLVDSTMVKVAFLGVVSFRRFTLDWGSGSVTMLTVMINLP